jgi:hypothetical protein
MHDQQLAAGAPNHRHTALSQQSRHLPTQGLRAARPPPTPAWRSPSASRLQLAAHLAQPLQAQLRQGAAQAGPVRGRPLQIAMLGRKHGATLARRFTCKGRPRPWGCGSA